MNGHTTKILTGLIVALLAAAVIGSFTMAQRLSSVETALSEIAKRQDRQWDRMERLDDRLRTVERRSNYPDLE